MQNNGDALLRSYTVSPLREIVNSEVGEISAGVLGEFHVGDAVVLGNNQMLFVESTHDNKHTVEIINRIPGGRRQ